MFSKSWLPLPLVTATGFAIPPIEFAIGILIILGLLLRRALTVGMLLMWLLTFGSCVLQQWSVVSEQLIYGILRRTNRLRAIQSFLARHVA